MTTSEERLSTIKKSDADLLAKRLSELENRIPVYEATIFDLKKKLDEVTAFPKEIEELKNLYSASAAKLEDSKGLIREYHSESIRRLNNHQNSLQAFPQNLQDLNVKIEN